MAAGAPVVNLSARESANARIGHIRKFCANPPERGVRLVLRTCEAETRTLGEWVRLQCDGSAAVPVDVDEALADHARATRAAVKADLEWLDDDGVRVSCKTLNHAAIIEPSAGDEFDQVGGPRSDTEAANRAFARMLLANNQVAMTALTSIISTQNQQISRTQEQVHARDLEIERMRLQHAREREKLERERLDALAQASAADGEATPHGELMAMLTEGLTSLVPALLQGPVGQALAAAVMGQPAGAPAPAQAPAGPRTPLPAPGGAPPAAPPEPAALPPAGSPEPLAVDVGRAPEPAPEPVP